MGLFFLSSFNIMLCQNLFHTLPKIFNNFSGAFIIIDAGFTVAMNAALVVPSIAQFNQVNTSLILMWNTLKLICLSVLNNSMLLI